MEREALQMCLEYIETNAHERKHVRHAIQAALAQPEYDYKDLYEKEKRKSAMWLAKYEEVAGPAPKAYPMAQPEQEPDDMTIAYLSGYYDGKKAALAGREWNFCERCGKRTADLSVIHTCTPPQEGK